MSHLLDNWLASLQSLPIEGVGSLHWNRKPATRSGKSAAIEAPTWELIFEEEPNAQLPTDFLLRLSCFANERLDEVESQYRAWLQQFRSDDYRVSIFGGCELRKEKNGSLEWSCPSPDALPVASLTNIPFSASYLYRRWDLANWLGVALTILGFAWVLFLFVQNGFHPEVGSSLLPIHAEPLDSVQQHYQEMR